MIWNEEMIRAELKRLDRKAGLNGAKLPIKFTHSKHSLGCFYPEKDNMRFDFSLYYLSDDSFPEEEALDLIRHEYAHFANFCLYHGTGHDRMWRKCCSEVGAVATRCYSGIFNDYFNQRKIQKAKAAEISEQLHQLWMNRNRGVNRSNTSNVSDKMLMTMPVPPTAEAANRSLWQRGILSGAAA